MYPVFGTDDTDQGYCGVDMQSFIDFVSHIHGKVYFHNLGFDGKFLLDWLLKNEYKHRKGKRKLRNKELKTLISDDGKFYTITVKWSTGFQTEFRDSLKKLPMTVNRIAKSFGMEISKLEIDYDQYRPVGYEPTDEEWEYISHDVEIVARALRQQLLVGMDRLTVGSDALTEYKRLMGPLFKRFYPTLPVSMDTEIRKAYRGGWTYADSRYRGKVLRQPIMVFDVNSLYPSVMYDRVLPVGMPVWQDGRPKPSEKYPLFITSVTILAKLKPNHVPCIQVKNNLSFQPSEYVTEIDDPTPMVCTNIDLALWQDHYDLDILSWNGSWLLEGDKGMFCQYIDKWNAVKMNSTGGQREIAKLHLNSLYGKFATNPKVRSKNPIIENDKVRLLNGEEEERDPVYTPMGVFITSYARDYTVRAAQRNYDIFAYADTDSLHLLTDKIPENLDVHPTELGKWKHEGDFTAGLYVRAKCYCEYSPECTCKTITQEHKRGCGYETHIAGLPYAIADQVEFTDFWDGHVFHGKLVPRTVPGGVVLEETGWKLSDEALRSGLRV